MQMKLNQYEQMMLNFQLTIKVTIMKDGIHCYLYGSNSPKDCILRTLTQVSIEDAIATTIRTWDRDRPLL